MHEIEQNCWPTTDMWQLCLKILLSATILVAVSELAKRSSFWGAFLASLPITSLVAFIWLYLDTGDIHKVATLAQGIFWLVLPSLVLFITLPGLLRNGLSFWTSMTLSCITTAIAYSVLVKAVKAFGGRL